MIYTIHCTKCDGTNVLYDAWAKWNPEKGQAELVNTFDDTHCDDCGGPCSTYEQAQPSVDLTPEGLQMVIPGCEKDRQRGPDQQDLF